MKLALLQALAIAVGGLSSLGSILIVLILLNRKSGPHSAFTFGLGYWGGYVGLGMLTVFVGADLFELDVDAGPSPVGAALLCVLGLVLSFVTVKQWRRPASETSESLPPSLMAKIDGFGPLRALGFGLVITLLNFKNLGIYVPAAAVLAGASLEPLEAALSVVVMTLVFCGGMLTPLGIYVLLPRRSAAWLVAIREFIETRGQAIVRVILPLIAILLLYKGGHGLWLLYFAS